MIGQEQAGRVDLDQHLSDADDSVHANAPRFPAPAAAGGSSSLPVPAIYREEASGRATHWSPFSVKFEPSPRWCSPMMFERDANHRRCSASDPPWGVALLSVFGLLALGLASIGLRHPCLAVNRRTREIGLRIALGAARSGLLRLIVREGMSLVAMGVVIGFVASLMVGRLLTRLLHGVNPTDPVGAASSRLSCSP